MALKERKPVVLKKIIQLWVRVMKADHLNYISRLLYL